MPHRERRRHVPLDDHRRAHPRRQRRVDPHHREQGDVREHINVFVDTENTRFQQGLGTPVPEGSTLVILAAVSGGYAGARVARRVNPSRIRTAIIVVSVVVTIAFFRRI